MKHTRRDVVRQSRVALSLVPIATLAIATGCATRQAPGAAQVATMKTTYANGAVVRTYPARLGDSAYPREAVAKGLFQGKVVVRFKVDGERVEVLRVQASDPVFEAAATGIVSGFTCKSERLIYFDVPLQFRFE